MTRIPTQYDRYRQGALDIVVEESTLDGDGAMIWEGALTNVKARIERELGVEINYQKLTKPLQESGCLRLLRKGGGTTGSVYEVRRTQYLTDDEGQDIIYDPADASPTRRNETQLLQFGRRMNEFDQRLEMMIENVVALAREVQNLVEWRDEFVRGQTVSAKQDTETEGGDDSGSEPAPEHGVRSLRVVEEGESLRRRLGLTGDPTIPGSA